MSPELRDIVRAERAKTKLATGDQLRSLLDRLASWCADLGFADAAKGLAEPAENVSIAKWENYGDQRSVYFVKPANCQAVKIGIARDIADRMATLQISTPDELELLTSLPGGAQLEALLHRAFDAHHIRGEWFNYAAPIVKLVELAGLHPSLWKETWDDGEDEWGCIHRGTLEEFAEDLIRRNGLELPPDWADSLEVEAAE